MGLFDRHDYGRDYHGEGRGMGDGLRGAWNRFENRGERGMHGRGYDRGMQGGRGGYGAADFAYRGLDGAWSTARNRGAHDVQWDWRRAGGSPYDQDLAGGGRGGGYGREYGARGYDRGMQGGGMRGRTRFGGARRAWQEGGPGRYDAQYRGRNGGTGEEPGYPRRGFGGWGRGR